MNYNNRESVKNRPENTRLRWHNKIKGEYMDTMKKKRQMAMSQGREERWFEKTLQHEFDKFKAANELAMRHEGIHDVDSLIEASIRQGEDEYDLYAQQEQSELEAAVLSYEQTVWCLNCTNGILLEDGSVVRCNLCGFYTTPGTLVYMQQHEQEHRQTCQYPIHYSAEPGNEGSIMGICEACDDWTIYNL
ncbi:hypothetical protein K501DRAFT_257026 [Backusella circina FSU 941]|nr:hypothetical protein K501DRAFT_264294 [Backusella circina FSU 941]KAI8879320.1 hypothetical protein K501DRAFT_257026 [Backusella circina FSU 941]